MQTTKIMVEFVVAGVMMALSVAFLASGIAPDWSQRGLDAFVRLSLWKSAVATTVVLSSLSYGLGIIAEMLAQGMFEWMLDRIKERRLRTLLKSQGITEHVPLLGELVRRADVAPLRADLLRIFGEMRYYVLARNAGLYAEIDSQLNRLRLVRVWAMVLGVLGAALLIRARYWGWAGALLAPLGVAIALGGGSYAVYCRFARYCRAVERAFKLLAFPDLAGRVETGQVETVARLPSVSNRA